MDPRGLDFSGKLFPSFRAIPRDVRLVAWARAIRWFGWGFAENLIPIFLLSFSATLTETGLLRSVYDVVFLFTLPIVGVLADVIPSKTLLIVGLLIYPFVGLGYLLAGMTGMVLFVILARIMNGVSYCLDSVGTDTYLRRSAHRRAIASVFGYTSTIANFWWLAAALAGVYLVKFVSISTLLFLITPFALIALPILLGIKKDTIESTSRLKTRTVIEPFVLFLKEIVALRKGLRGTVFLMFILDVASVAASFFIPIDAYRNGASIPAVALLTVISTIPSIFEFWLAEFIDGNRKKRKWSLLISLTALPVLFVAAGAVSTLSGRIVVAFGIELAAIFGSLALQSYATTLSRRDRYGEISSVLEGASTLGDLVGPIAIGMLADAAGLTPTFAIFAGIFFLVALFFIRRPIER